jgi:L-cysteine desulfidase
MENERIVQILKEQVKPAFGCTEPVAVAIAVSKAAEQINGNIENVSVKLSPNIYKNGMRVGIPGTSEKGIPFAIALSIICGNSDLGLEIFKNVNEKDINQAKEFLKLNIIDIQVENKKAAFYIEANIKTNEGTSKCVIEDSHTNIVLVEANGNVIYEKKPDKRGDSSSNDVHELGNLTIKELREAIEQIPFKDLEFLLEGAKMNMDMAIEGLSHGSGLGLGAGIDKLMKGVCKQLNLGDEKLARALAFSHLVTIYIKEYTGKLSPICGCSIAAGIGASVSVAWLIGCNDYQIAGTIKNMVGNLAGMLCDGAKGGCALKLSTASSEAILSAELAKNNIIISNFDGIVGEEAETTIKNLGKLCVEGMKGIDNKIIEIMCNK